MSFNSLAPRGANLSRTATSTSRTGVSTHSPRGGRTVVCLRVWYEPLRFNSLAPRGANRRNGKTG